MYRVIVSHCTDPFINLAAEDRMFRSLGDGERLLFLWRNREAVIMGRYQNPFLECSLKEMRKEGVPLVRRQSGGGTVYHDQGNTNFTFVTPRDAYDKEGNSRIVTTALKNAFGIEAYPSGRNDILVEGKKISGSAFKLSSNKAFHHGTLLVHADLLRLSRFLKPEQKEIEGKGIRSVPSKVTNLSCYVPDIDHEKVCSALIDTISYESGGRISLVNMDEKGLLSLKGCTEKAEELKSWEWIIGKTPPFTAVFTNIFPFGKTVLRCRVLQGFFEEVLLEGEGLSAEFTQSFRDALISTACDPEEILKKRKEVTEVVRRKAEFLFQWLAAEF